MTSAIVYLCGVPAPFWNSNNYSLDFDLSGLVSEALGCERRILKGVNLENEYERYILVCRRLEQNMVFSNRVVPMKDQEEFHSSINNQKCPLYKLPYGYIGLLRSFAGEESKSRLGKNFYPPNEVEGHIQAINQLAKRKKVHEENFFILWADFYQMAVQNNCGVIEIQSGFHKNRFKNESLVIETHTEEKVGQDCIQIPEYILSGTEIEALEGNKKKHMAERLEEQIKYALVNNEPISFGNQAPHDVFTEVLNKYVFVPPDQPLQHQSIQVIYADGSEAMPFPLFCLPQKESVESSAPALRIAMMSMRHLEMDPEIDFCWFRNREVSRNRSLAETDQFCYDMTLQQMSENLQYGPMNLQIFHTGFEPAVIGFYRGVVQTMSRCNVSNGLRITPFYYRGSKGYQRGKVWG